MVKAIYAGSFDPVTCGHLDVIFRAATLFDELVVAVGHNPHKRAMFTPIQRVEMVQRALPSALTQSEQNGLLERVSVCSFTGLVAQLAKEQGAAVLVKGLRGSQDFPGEFQQAATNLELGGINTVFFPTLPKWQHVSSSLVRELMHFGAPIDAYVPPAVAEFILSQRMWETNEHN